MFISFLICHYVPTGPVIHQDQDIEVGNCWFHAKDFSEVLSKCRREKSFRPCLGFPKVDGMTITRGFIAARENERKRGLTLSYPHPGECLEKATDRARQRGGRHEKT